ncbi:hypothetical protein LOTGIDRAFT_227939 [Lottia gigantea]|uniref:Uncharacterized protein n=1 Tax=Lottia gigantea TaxID=225164 RepID=V4AM86_LOTGI|nr:hypothetical protein LOTGIDRAFT_227939 [Lottia gigantea]ESP05309.1 hypothetical protein LOTGIDRAFT_227939 [Lottia gigantea]
MGLKTQFHFIFCPGGNCDTHRVVRQCNTQMDYGYQNPPMQQINPQGGRYPSLPNHQYIYQNQPSSSYSRQNDYIRQKQLPNSLNGQTHHKEAPRVIYDPYDQSMLRQGRKRPFLENRSPEPHQEEPQVPIPTCQQYVQNFTSSPNSKLQNQGTVYNDPQAIHFRTEPQARYQYLPEGHRTLQFPQEKEPSLISRTYLEEFLPIEQGIQTPIPIHARPESMEEFESEHLKPGPSEMYNYLPGTRRDLSSAFKPYINSRLREREPQNQSGCREMFHSRQYNDRQTGEKKDPFDKRLFNNQYHANTANRDRFIIPIRENSEFENQDKRKLISNRVHVIMEDVDDPSGLNSSTNTHKPLETLETAERSQNMDKIMYAKRVAHKFDDASKQIIIPAPSKIKVRTQHGHKHHKTSQLAGMLNHVAAGASTFDGNSYLVQSMVGGVGGMNPMHTAYQQQYFYPPIAQPEYQYIPQYVTYNQPMPITPSYVPENEYGGTYFQLTGTNHASYNPVNAYLQQTYSESDYSGQSSQEDLGSHGERSMITDGSKNKDEIQVSMPEKLDTPAFGEHDLLGLTRKESREDTIQPKPSIKAAVEQLENNVEDLFPIIESEVMPSRMPFPEQPENIPVNETGQDSIKGFDRMSTNESSSQPDFALPVDIEDDFEDFLLGTAKPMETGIQKSERPNEKDMFDLDVLFEGDFYKRDIIQYKSSDHEKSEGSNFPNSQNTTQIDSQNTFQKNVKDREKPSINTSEDNYDDFIAELMGETRVAGTGTAHETAEEMSNSIQSRNRTHTPSDGKCQDVQPPQFRKGEVEVSPILSNSGAASEDFYSELLEDLLGNAEIDGAQSTMPENEAAVDLSSNCDTLVHFHEPPTHSLQDLIKDMGSSVSSILSDILSTSH